jgi:hypothetical protein
LRDFFDNSQGLFNEKTLDNSATESEFCCNNFP